MIIGILSDTHGHVGRTVAACQALIARGAEVVLHCGDIGSEEVLIELVSQFAPVDIPVHAVLGNVDLYDQALPAFPESTGVKVWGRLAVLELDGKSIAVIHGDDWRTMERLQLDGEHDYIFSGHTHEAADARFNNTRMINPGAVYRANPPTVAILDLQTDRLEHLEFM
jgi:putative phosphoesterase